MLRFDKIDADQPANTQHAHLPTQTESAESNMTTKREPQSEPPVNGKPVKREAMDDDAQLAARLQAEEDGRARPTRGVTKRKTAPTKGSNPKKKEKSAKKVKAEDDSDVEGSSGPEVKKTGAFHVCSSKNRQ